MAAKTVCIMCGKERNGIRVREDHVIRAIRWIKRNVTRSERNNTLVVCRECYPKYKAQRSRFVTRRALYVGMGILFFVFGNLLEFSLSTLLITTAVLLFFYLLALFNYVPALDIGKAKKETAVGAKK
jgi:hypothetical protein